MSKSKLINGITRPMHPFQIITYVFFSGCFIIYFLVTFPLSSTAERIVGAILEVVFGLSVFISGYIATTTDTTDSLVKETHKLKSEGKDFSHIHSEYHCGYERSFVHASSKHCRRCGRCTEGFDHHCKWINNDIGKANYKSFVTLISSVVLFLVTFIVFGAIVTARYVKENDLSNYDIWIFPHRKGNILGGLIVMWIFMALACVFTLLDFNLVLFHIFLIKKGLTTFQYITLVEERKEYQREMTIALKAMGEKKKTRLDFILCLKVKKKLHRVQTTSAPTPGENGETQGKPDSVRVEENRAQLGKSDKDLPSGLMMNDEEMADKMTALNFYTKDGLGTETNELLFKHGGDISPQIVKKNSKINRGSIELESKTLTKEQENKRSKVGFLVIDIQDKNAEPHDSSNKPSLNREQSHNAANVEELDDQECINEIKKEEYEVDHDHHLHKLDPNQPSSASEKRVIKTPVKVRVGASGTEEDKTRVNPQESRHNNYMNFSGTQELPSFFLRDKAGKYGYVQPTEIQNEHVPSQDVKEFEAEPAEQTSKINTYKEVEDFIDESKPIDGDVAQQEGDNRSVSVKEGSRSKGHKKNRSSKELKIEVIG